MTSYAFLLAIAIILLSTKLFGLLSQRVHMPAVVGALVAGILLGPSCFGFIEETDFLLKTSEIGVIFLMFLAGLDTDLDELKKSTSGADNMRAQIKDYLEDAAKAKLAAEEARREVERLRREIGYLKEKK